MKLITTYGLIVILAIFASCSNSKMGKVVIEERLAIPKTKSEKLFKQLRPESQTFQVNADSDNVITGKNGTQVFVPKNSFVNADGELVSGKVDIEIIEVLSVADFIKTNLQTVSNGRPLQSEGMLYIDAKSNGQQIALATDKRLQVELPNMNEMGAASGVKIFSGNYDASGNINWTQSGKLENKLIALPLEFFDFDTWTSYRTRISADEGSVTSYDSYFAKDSTTFKHPSLENTFIATREFEERYNYIKSAEWEIGGYNSSEPTNIQKKTIIKDSTISLFYLNNLGKDLWYCDSLAYAYMKTWEGKVNFKGIWFAEMKTNDLLNAFKKFYEQKLTTVINFPADVDLSSKDARGKLLAKGLKETEVDEVLGAYERQNKIVTARRNKVAAQNISANSFEVAKLGWINCDRFYDEPTAKEANILASVNDFGNYDFVNLTLIINGQRVALSGTLGEDSKFTFTGKSQPYTKLPIGEKATIVGMTYKNDKPYLGMKEIVISEKGDYSIDLQASSTQDIQTKLNGIQ